MGADLPSEAEWEAAARGGFADAEFAWGDEYMPAGVPMANVWQGQFPFENLLEDGWARTSPVGSFPPNGYGLFDMIGNVWEWTRDWWATGGGPVAGCCARRDSAREALRSVDPSAQGAAQPHKVIKGGSHLCAPSYCRRYRPAARHPQSIDTSTGHVGFRCVVRPANSDRA
jgi:formylglycine-generating enzyme required for sulfatase activity